MKPFWVDSRGLLSELGIALNIATWNLNHRAARKTIPDTIAPAIVSVNADLLVFTEFVHCDIKQDRADFYSQLDDAGYIHRLLSPLTPKQNHILIASRTPISQGDLLAPTTIHPAIPSNFLHVRALEHDIEIIGVRVPDYSKPVYKETAAAYWSWFSTFTASISDRQLVLIGDFNIDPEMKKYKHRHHLAELVQTGWSIASPEHGASFWANKNNAPHRLDHAFLTEKLSHRDAVYVDRVEGYWTCGENKYKEPDHAILTVEVV